MINSRKEIILHAIGLLDNVIFCDVDRGSLLNSLCANKPRKSKFFFQNKMIVNITIKGILLLMIFFPCSCVGYFNVDITKTHREISAR